MNKKLISLLIIVCFCAGGYAGWQFWTNKQQAAQRASAAQQAQRQREAALAAQAEEAKRMAQTATAAETGQHIEQPAGAAAPLAAPQPERTAEASAAFAAGREPLAAPGTEQKEAPPTLQETELEVAKTLLASVNRVSYAPATKRDPTVSKTEKAMAELQERNRLRAIAEEERRQEEARRKAYEEEQRRLRAAEEARLHPERAIINKINLQGIISQEAFINDRVYTTGQTVLGARIMSISGGEVTFAYKGKTFKKVLK